MKLFLLLFLSSMAIAANPPTATRAPHPYEFVRTGNTRRVNELGSKAPHHQSQLNRLKSSASNVGDKPLYKKASGVPPYAVLMEPLVKYSQPDPLYNESKEKISEIKPSDVKKSDLIKTKKVETKDETRKQISSKTGHIIEDSAAEGTHLQKQVEYGTYYEGPIYEEPEPIIEIIIKESNESLPTPPPITTTTQKRKKEPVQVFFVKYKKDPSAHYGEEKIIYDAPVPAITPPTNNADPHDYDEEEHHPHHEEYHGEIEEHTLPPRPSTTLKAIIKPDSEIVHGSSLHITFGKPKHGGDGHGNGFGGYGPESHHHYNSHHRGDHEEQSAPKPSIALPPPKRKPSIAPRASSESQLTKRNPAPFHSQTLPPQQSFGPSFSTPREFHRPTPPPSFQQTPQFGAQPFKPQLPQIPQVPKVQPNHPAAPPTPSRPSPTLRYSTLPQHLQQHPKPQQSFPSFPPVRHHPPQQPAGATQQYYSINQPHLKASFHVNVRPTPPQQYHTISSQASQQNNFLKSQPHPPNPPPPPVHNQHSKPLPQPLHALPQQSNSFSQLPNSFGPPQHPFPQSIPPQNIPGPLIQRPHQGPVLLPQNPFQNRGIFPPPQQQHQPHPPPQHHPPHPPPQLHQPPQPQQHQPIHQQPHHQLHQQSHQQIHQQIHQQQLPQIPQPQHQQQQHQHQVEQLNRLQQQQQHLQSQILQDQQKQFLYQQQQQQKFQTTYAPEIIKSVSPDISFTNHRFEVKQPLVPTVPTTSRPQFSQNLNSNVKYSASQNFKTSTESFRKYPQTTTPQPVEYVTEDPKKAEEERRKKEERKKQNVAALPKEVPDDLREQLLSSGILGNADIQILDYDKIGDIPIESLPPDALANFRAVASGSEPVPSIVRPDSRPQDTVAEASEQSSVVVPPNGPPSEVMEMKVVRYNPESKEGAKVANQYVKEGATQLEPVVLNDSKYNRYLPLKVAGAQFPVPDVPELRGKNVTSVVVLAPVDYEFLQRHEDIVDEEARAGRRSSHPVLEVQGVHFVAGDVLKTLVKTPTSENYRKWLDKENKTSLDKQSVVLLVIESKNNGTVGEKEIFMYDIGTQKVSKLNGELSAQFVEVAESNSENDDLEEISDSNGGDFTVKDTAQVHTRAQRKAIASVAATIQKNKSISSPR